MAGWIGCDLDGTLAEYHGMATGGAAIGKPIPEMQKRVKRWLKEGRDVRIFTARVGGINRQQAAHERELIGKWCEEHLGKRLPVTCCKDFGMVELWDDRATEVRINTGIPVNPLKRDRE